MSKKGRQRRTPEKRIADRERRSTVAYVMRMAAEFEAEQQQEVSETKTEKK